MLSVELQTLLRNVRLLLELESCFPRERLLQADEMSARCDVAEAATADEMPQGWRADAELSGDLPDGQIGPQQQPHFRNTISELVVLLRPRRAVGHEARPNDVATQSGAGGCQGHAASPSCV